MEAVFGKIAEETSTFNLGDEDKWRTLYEPLYPPPPASITVHRNERYGPHVRNLLDVFIPASNDTDKNRPVLIYIHGGGFFSGDKQWSEKVYSNIGYFFAQHNIVTVVVNHRLVPDVVYPGGAEDMQRAREWVYRNIGKERFGYGAREKVVLFGHSSGGAHVAMNFRMI